MAEAKTRSTGASVDEHLAVRGKDLVVHLTAESPTQRALRAKPGPHRMGKACVWLERLSGLDAAVLEELIAGRAQRMTGLRRPRARKLDRGHSGRHDGWRCTSRRGSCMSADTTYATREHRRMHGRGARRGAALVALLIATGTAQAGGEPASPAAAKRGERLFLQCRACHSLGTETAGKIGPPLVGLLGRAAGTYPDFKYSPALAGAGLTWDEATLDRWLASPATLVPGTAMVFVGLPKPEDRRVLIEYLRTATRPAQ